MLVAKDKLKSNIGEYFLYMFQVEDLIRACNFDISIIKEKLVSQYETNEQTKTEISNWYSGLNDLMLEEKLQSKGHLSFLTNKIHELFDFHLYLIQSEDEEYLRWIKKNDELIADLKSKQIHQLNDVNAILNAIYGIYLMKLKKQEVSEETLISVSQLSKQLALLSKKFKDYETGKLAIE
ncbi:MAG: DUF4924 family protein [Salinivirgaceae bacterium]|nr:DUF4924 family protein [Salinivirgaceae bacterium]